MKLLTSRKHGAILAAATFGLPETPGGERNWDYRFTWIRDASFTVYAFMRLGKPKKLNILYAIDGRQELPEIELPHLSGHGGAVRPLGPASPGYLRRADIWDNFWDEQCGVFSGSEIEWGKEFLAAVRSPS